MNRPRGHTATCGMLVATLGSVSGCSPSTSGQPVQAAGASDAGMSAPAEEARTSGSRAGHPYTQRFQIVFSPHVRADTFLLDTRKGRVWRMVQVSGSSEAIVFEEVEVLNEARQPGGTPPAMQGRESSAPAALSPATSSAAAKARPRASAPSEPQPNR